MWRIFFWRTPIISDMTPSRYARCNRIPPLGTLYAAAALREHGISAAVFDSMLQDPVSGFLEILRQQKPRILAIYAKR